MKYTFTITPISENSLLKRKETFEFSTEDKAKYWFNHFNSLVTFLDIEVSDIKQIIEESDKGNVTEQISVSFDAYTDGDYGLREADFKRRMSNRYDNIDYSYTCNDFYEFYLRCVVDDSKGDDPKISAKNFIENIVRELSFNHLYLMKDFYEMTEEARKWLFNKTDERQFVWTLSGNYEGTQLTIVREYKEK